MLELRQGVHLLSAGSCRAVVQAMSYLAHDEEMRLRAQGVSEMEPKTRKLKDKGEDDEPKVRKAKDETPEKSNTIKIGKTDLHITYRDTTFFLLGLLCGVVL